MTKITLQDGKLIFRDGKIGTEKECCCCNCEAVPAGTALPNDTPVSITSDCPCFDNGTLSGSGTLDSIAWSECDSLPSFGTLEIGFCNGKLFVIAGVAWQSEESDPFDLENSGRSYGSFVGCPPNTVTESGGDYSGTITIQLDVITDGVASTCILTITLG